MNTEALFTEENIALFSMGVLFVLLAYYYYARPPKEINRLYGHRTPRSMKNQQTWDAANERSSKDFFSLAFVVLIVGIFLIPINFEGKVIIQMVVLLVGLGWTVWRTETYLKNNFDKDGNPKNS